jgi:predicted kinase
MTLWVIHGAPCAGKSTYIREHAQPGDIVIDFDRMAQAFGSPDTHDHNEHHKFVTIAARRAAIRQAFIEHERGAAVWIAQVNITPKWRDKYLYHGAKIVTLDVDPAELHRRASASRPPEWHSYIDEWEAIELSDRDPFAAHSELWPE